MENNKIYRVNYIKMVVCGILTAISFLLLHISRTFSAFSPWYSTKLYPIWVNLTGRFMSIFPFSVSEVFLYILFLFLPLSVIWLIVRLSRGGIKAGYKRKAIISWFTNLILLATVLFFLYVLNCGINYYRDSFSKTSGFVMEEYTAAELKAVCLWLTEEVNDLHDQVVRDVDGVMVLDGSVAIEAVAAMKKLGEEFPELSGYYSRPKGLLIPQILSVQSLAGVYSPFTIEANYNSGMLAYNIPFTACHELSHLRGFMQEEEANFIAFLASSKAEQAAFRYSGYLTGWIYCMNVLYQADFDSWQKVWSHLAEGVNVDLSANREFWARYESSVSEVTNKINDTYLKANGQEEGVKSYNQMVDLIVAYYYEQ